MQIPYTLTLVPKTMQNAVAVARYTYERHRSTGFKLW